MYCQTPTPEMVGKATSLTEQDIPVDFMGQFLLASRDGMAIDIQTGAYAVKQTVLPPNSSDNYRLNPCKLESSTTISGRQYRDVASTTEADGLPATWFVILQ